MTYVLERDGIMACPDCVTRTGHAPEFERPDLCRELVFGGLKDAIRHERPFMGKPHTWWLDLILDQVYELTEDFDEVRYAMEVSEYEDY